jgi:hypothetical protein
MCSLLPDNWRRVSKQFNNYIIMKRVERLYCGQQGDPQCPDGQICINGKCQPDIGTTTKGTVDDSEAEESVDEK